MVTKRTTAVELTLTATRRTAQGTRPARRFRAAGLVPGIVYGKATAPVAVVVPQRELTKVLHTKAGEHALVTLRIEEGTAGPGPHGGLKAGAGKPWEKPVLIHRLQHDPVDAHIVHVDFHAIALTERLRVKIPVLLRGEAVGVKQEGGVLEHFLREIEVECLPTEIPGSVEFDVSALKIGDTVHVRDLAPPKQAKITSDPDGVIASVQAPKVEVVEEAAAPTEPEILREKKEAAEGEAAEAAPPEAGAGKKDAKEPKEKEKEKETK